MEEATTYRFPCKCLKCSMHFNVYSWEPDWAAKNKRFCPECGKAGAFSLGREALDSEIFQHVEAVISPETLALLATGK